MNTITDWKNLKGGSETDAIYHEIKFKPRKSKRIKWINARLSDIVDIVKETLKSIYYGRKFLICIL